MLFGSWESLGRTVLVGVCGYVALIAILRVSGKRTLSKMNAFDFVVTVALGSTFGSLLLSKDVPLAEGVTALATLVGLQFVATWSSVRSPTFRDLVKSTPTLLVHRGVPIREAMVRERITEQELRAAVREQGVGTLEQVAAVVLETSGELSVVDGQISSWALEGVRTVDGQRGGE